MSLESDILQALSGRTAQQPMKVANLAELLAVSSARVESALADLHDRHAVNRATVTKAGDTHEVVWLTGMKPPAGPNWRTKPILKHTWADAKAAHEAQAQAEASRDVLPHTSGAGAPSSPLEFPPAPLLQSGEKTTTQEIVMPRIAKPAKPKAEHPKSEPARAPKPYVKAAQGAVISQALAGLAGTTQASALATDELLARVPAAASVGSLRATLRTLARRGAVRTEGRTARNKMRYFWWLPDADTSQVIEPDPLQAAAEALDLDAPGTTRFALWDDGQLLLSMGDDMMVLDAGATRRLADFLESCMGL